MDTENLTYVSGPLSLTSFVCFRYSGWLFHGRSRERGGRGLGVGLPVSVSQGRDTVETFNPHPTAAKLPDPAKHHKGRRGRRAGGGGGGSCGCQLF